MEHFYILFKGKTFLGKPLRKKTMFELLIYI